MNVVVRRFLTVNRLGLQCGKNFGERHGRGIGAQRVEDVDEYRVLNRANLQALEVFGFDNRTAAVRDMAKACFEIAQTHQIFLRHALQQATADRAIQNQIDFLEIGEQEGQVKNAKFFHHRCSCSRGHQCDFQNATLRCRN